MESQISTQQILTIPNNLTSLVTDLNRQLTNLKPNNSEVCQVITYALIATAVVGLLVYQYIREIEKNG
ncbi:MAG: hypothetical protein I3274_02735 [Candidatus Moeniiplasma glomeromycotorum]|nr:hypothetical protein [Candidatus Moeniiplasma glomeromycotorum]MCE8167521.1 hypothetical protein [Candidatus Moeniiplasma glomeromycotorum]